MRAHWSSLDASAVEIGVDRAPIGEGRVDVVAAPNEARPVQSRLAAVLSTVCLAGCGGGAPLLHGAHTLSPGVITAGAGFSSTFASGEARRAANPPAGSVSSEDAARGTAVLAALAPSVAPWVGGRVGLEGDNEAGLTYTGRGARLDVRHGFESGPIAWSAGIGVSTLFSGSDQSTSFAATTGPRPQRFQIGLGSLGFDVPLLVGWRSDAGIVSVWAGARGGYERITGHALPVDGPLPEPMHNLAPEMTAGLALHRTYAGGVAGFAVGFRHVHVAFELDTFYQWVGGDYADRAVKLNGLTLTPAGALLFTF